MTEEKDEFEDDEELDEDNEIRICLKQNDEGTFELALEETVITACGKEVYEKLKSKILAEFVENKKVTNSIKDTIYRECGGTMFVDGFIEEALKTALKAYEEGK